MPARTSCSTGRPEPGPDLVRDPPDVGEQGPFGVQPRGVGVGGQPADPVDHRVHPVAGQALELASELLPQRGGGGGDAEAVGHPGQEPQVAEHPGVLGQQGAQPDRARRDLQPEQLLAGERDGELGREGRLPVVAVGQHQDLPVVADLEELLDPAVQRTHDHRRLGDDAVRPPTGAARPDPCRWGARARGRAGRSRPAGPRSRRSAGARARGRRRARAEGWARAQARGADPAGPCSSHHRSPQRPGSVSAARSLRPTRSASGSSGLAAAGAGRPSRSD